MEGAAWGVYPRAEGSTRWPVTERWKHVIHCEFLFRHKQRREELSFLWLLAISGFLTLLIILKPA